MFKKIQYILLGLIITMSYFANASDKLPTINVGYIFTTNHTPLQVALSQGETYQVGGFHLKELLAKEKYALFRGSTPIANLDIIVTKSGSETSTLFAQNRLDIALASITAVLAGIDQGVSMKIVSPLVLISGGVVVPVDAKYDNWSDLVIAIKSSQTPFKIGYHSPTSAPIIILKGALASEGVTFTQDPNDTKSNVLLVDLKSTTNLLISLSSKQVDAVVGPEPLPQTAAFKKIGKSISELRELPPVGKWAGFPCCVVIASDKFIKESPELVKEFVSFISASIDWSNKHHTDASKIAAEWIGLPIAVGEQSNLQFINAFTDEWKNGVRGYMDVLNEMDSFNGQLKGKDFNNLEELLINYQFIGNE